MDDALVLARLGLAAVFVVAGVAKLLDRPGSRQALTDFDVPDLVLGPMVFLLPAAELLTATALLFSTTARWGAVGAVLLFALFVFALTRALRRGAAPECHCFGQVHSEPASWLTVARNAALALPAAYVTVAGPGPSLVSWVDGHSGQELWLIATGSLAALATVTSIVLWRQNTRLRSTQAWTPPTPVRLGARAPRFSLPSVDGALVTLQDLVADGRPCVLTFVAPACGPCATFLPEVARWHETLADRLALPVLSSGDVNMAGELARDHGLAMVLADAEGTVSRAYGVPGTPCAVLVAPDGTVGSAPAAGQVAIEALVRLALEDESLPVLSIHQVETHRG